MLSHVTTCFIYARCSSGRSEVVSHYNSYWLMWTVFATNVHWFFSPVLFSGLSSLQEVSDWNP